MTDFHDDPEDDVTDEPEAEAADETPKALRRAAAEGKKAKADLASARRELAMVKAGVDTDSPLGAMFVKAYDGEADVETIKTQWAAIAPAAATAEVTIPTPDEPNLADGEAASTAERQALAANSPADAPVDVDPNVTALDVHRGVIAKGGTNDDALSSMFETIVGAAHSGDPRVLVNHFQGE